MHYCLPLLHRFDLDEVMRLIAQHRYFVLHAPRQTGKTSSLLALQDYLNETEEYRALYVNVEGAQAAREDVELGITSVVQTIARQAYYTLQDDAARSLAEKILARHFATAALESFLAAWCESQAKPTILLIDEIDSLVGDTLIAVLRQLRSGYAQRPQRFPQSLILCGVRDVRDYRLRTDEGKAMITGGSALSWLGRFDYQEAAPQLLLQAFLQRIVNGDGAIFREYGLGRRRTDLLIIWPLDRSATPQQPPQQPDRQKQRIVVEVKLLYRSLDATIQLGVTQTKAYMDRCAADEGYLCIFDRSSAKSWEEKIFAREVDGISVWGCESVASCVSS